MKKIIYLILTTTLLISFKIASQERDSLIQLYPGMETHWI